MKNNKPNIIQDEEFTTVQMIRENKLIQEIISGAIDEAEEKINAIIKSGEDAKAQTAETTDQQKIDTLKNQIKDI